MNARALKHSLMPSYDFINDALKDASPNALRLALLQQTADPELANMNVIKRHARGGALTTYTLSREDRDRVIEKAHNYFANPPEIVAQLSIKEVKALIECFTGMEATDSEVNYAYEELAIDPLPRAANWTKKPPEAVLEKSHVIIIGSGFSGLAAAVQLRHLGIPYTILERHPDIGGTWFVNDYPDARVDVSTFLYQYKFERNYPWKSYYADQAELKEYIDHIADKYDIRRNIRLNCDVTSAHWNQESGEWTIAINQPDGSKDELRTRFLISAMGLFRMPKRPDIDGLDDFEGPVFHTTEWDHSVDYTGQNVAVIGTGSTGSQLVPKVAETAKTVTVYQRSANWVTPVKGYKAEVSQGKRWLLDNLPSYAAWYTFASYVAELPAQNLQEIDPDYVANGGCVNESNTDLENALRDYIRFKVGNDDVLFEKLIPSHPPLARRLVIDNEWYDTLVKDHVELVSGGIKQITKTGIIGDDGIEREADILVLSSGFEVSEFLWPVNYVGREGTTLQDIWKSDGSRAYKGMTLPGFPNFFMFYGPNAQARAGSFHSWVEILSRYIGGLIVKTIEEDAVSIEVSERAFEEYNEQLDKRMSSLLWETQGKGGYYIDKGGRSHINMPWRMHEFYDMVQEPDLDKYILRPRS